MNSTPSTCHALQILNSELNWICSFQWDLNSALKASLKSRRNYAICFVVMVVSIIKIALVLRTVIIFWRIIIWRKCLQIQILYIVLYVPCFLVSIWSFLLLKSLNVTIRHDMLQKSNSMSTINYLFHLSLILIFVMFAFIPYLLLFLLLFLFMMNLIQFFFFILISHIIKTQKNAL